MSDLSEYELEDIVWDDFDKSDDHIVPNHCDEHLVPNPSDELGSENVFLGDKYKKIQHDVFGLSSDSGDLAAKYYSLGKEGQDFPTLKRERDTMLENNSCCHTPEAIFPASHDSKTIEEATSSRMSSHGIKWSNADSIGSEFCAKNPLADDRCASANNNSHRYLDHIPQADNNLSVFGNNCEDKESSDPLYYGWPCIGNFEDVDGMLRSCDSEFGLGAVGNEDDFSWFSSSHAIGGSGDVLKSDFMFPESSPLKSIPEPLNLFNASSSVDETNIDCASVSYKKSSSLPSEDDEHADLSQLSFVNASDTTANKEKLTSPEQHTHSHKKQSKHHNDSEQKRRGCCLENGTSLQHISNLQLKDTKLPSVESSHQIFTSPDIQQQVQSSRPDLFGYFQAPIPYMHRYNGCPLDQISVCPTPSGIKSENSSLISFSQKESSYASNQGPSMESSHDFPFEDSAAADETREKLCLHQGFQSSFTSNYQQADLVMQSGICNPISVQKPVHRVENDVNPSEEGVGVAIPAELDSTDVPGSFSMNSGLDEISLEAAGFRQLQHVMEQLDLRTKLCIRDSLYRLARSAEQRHNHANLGSCSRDDRETSGASMSEAENKCSFMDIETNTNPIDRSIAHLLFHRPSDSSIMPAYDAPSLKTHKIYGSFASLSETAGRLVFPGKTVNEADKQVADH